MDERRFNHMVKMWKRNDPAGLRRVQELAGRIKEIYDSEEFQVFWEPAKTTISHGDESRVRAWAGERIGCEPDFVLRVYLRKRELGDATPRETWALVDDRGEKLRSEARGEPDDLGVSTFEVKSKTFARLWRIKSKYRKEDWPLEVARAIRKAGAENQHGYPLTLSAIDWRIERDNRWRGVKGTPGRESPEIEDLISQVRAARERAFAGDLKPQEHRDAMEAWRRAEEELEKAKSFANTASLSTGGPGGEELPVDDDDRIVRTQRGLQRIVRSEQDMDRQFLAYYASPKNPAGLSPHEREVFELSITLGNADIAERVGRPKEQIAVEKHSAIRKVQKHHGIKKFT